MSGLHLRKRYLLLAPIIILIGIGILTKTTNKIASPQSACVTDDLTGMLVSGGNIAFFEGKSIEVPDRLLADSGGGERVLGVASPEDRWIEVDLSDQKLKAWDGQELYLETPVSSGLPHTPTPTGEFRIWVKLRAAKMEGGEGRYYYYLPNVPYVMYLENDQIPGWRGYGLHGTYWHNDFGTPRSHGCVNLPTPIAEKLYYWVMPNLPQGKYSVFASDSNQGTRVMIHE